MSRRRDPHADLVPEAQRPACWPARTLNQTAQDEDDADAEALARLHARTVRADGWTPDRQRLFLESIADGHSVTAACGLCGLSVASVYAFRRRASGAGFAIGWDAARLLARETIADTLTARALEGQVERVTRPDGTVVERFRYDNRLAAALLTRLDRQVAATDEPAGHAARLVASEFQAYLAQLGDGGPSRAALFLARRLGGEGGTADALAPVVAMAHADSFVRANGALPQEVDTRDLDVTDRVHWTAAQWARAEAAGLIALAAPPRHEPQLPQLNDADPDGEVGDSPVWQDDWSETAPPEWRTSFPPPPDFDGDEAGTYGDPDYSRALTEEEEAIVEAGQALDAPTETLEEAVAARDAWFARMAAEARGDNPEPAPCTADDP